MFRKGTALLIVLITLVLMSLEVAMISLIVIRGFGSEGLLVTQSTAARRAAEIAVNRLRDKLETYLGSSTPASAATQFAQGQTQSINNATLMLDNPDSGTTSSAIQISAWIKERRGNLYHIIGRAQNGSIDITLHRWILVKVCPNGGLITILTDRNSSDSYDSRTDNVAAVDDGRVMFGENDGKLWTWKQGTGLSTLMNSNVATSSSLTASGDGRFYIGTNRTSAPFRTWSESTGFTTITTGLAYPGTNSSVLVPSGGVVFASGASSGPLYIWKPNGTAMGALTLMLTGYFPNGKQNVHVSSSGRVFMGENWSSRNFYTWSETTGLSTIVTGQDEWGGIVYTNDGKLLFGGENISSGKYYRWFEDGTASGNLSTLVQDGQLDDVEATVASDGKVYVGTSGGSWIDKCWLWSAGTLTTIINSSCSNVQSDGGNNIFFRSYVSPMFMQWNNATGLTTLLDESALGWGSGDIGYYGMGSILATSDNRIYFSGYSDKIWTWKNGVFTTIIDLNASEPVGLLGVFPNGRVFFNHLNTSGQLWTWKEDTGLSTIIDTAAATNDPGHDFALSAQSGWVFFGENSAPGKFWAWQEPQQCDLN